MKAFGLWSAVFMGIGAMVGAGIFIVIGQAGSMAGNIVWLSFIFGGIIALLSGYSLAKLALKYPSRGGIIEYLVQEFGVNIFSGGMGILFYFAQLIAIGAVAKSFGAYATKLFIGNQSIYWIDLFAVGIVAFFTVINLIGAAMVAKSENFIVIIKLSVLVVFVIAAFFTIKPDLLSLKDTPPISGMFFAIGITFFAYQGFSVITNTVEDMKNPKKNMLRAMHISILIVALLYVATSIAVLGNMPLGEVVKAKDYALALAVKPVFGDIGFKIMAITALIATSSAINATLYAATEISYVLAKDGNLPKVYEYNVFNSFDGLIVSAVLVIPMILFFNLGEITAAAAISMLIIQAVTHLGHLKLTNNTKANKFVIWLAFIFMTIVAGLTSYYSYKTSPIVIWYLIAIFIGGFIVEIILRKMNKRKIIPQS